MAAPPDAPDAQPAHANRLAAETSPYLLQHAANPVDWYPWGEEAFEEARRRGVPIFLSVGYSTCYWCHVMERESFESEATAAVMNANFVCVKVDREERPDVDDIYMAAVQLMTGQGGWPMSVWMTPPGARGESDPGLEPFYAGTYFPPRPAHGRPSFTQVLTGIGEAWRDSREDVLTQAERVTESVREQLARAREPVRVDQDQVSEAIALLMRIHDRQNGGFGGAPKFPQPVYLEFLTDLGPTIRDPAVRASVERAVRLTLDRMALGGIYDHVGGGFHRYSVDEAWAVPHFEKMLYDNAQLAGLYAKSHLLTGDEEDARTLRDILAYVRREMTAPGGAFYSAQDAEVNGREGQNYLWTRAQLVEVLGEDDGAFAADVYSVDAGANFTDPHHPEDGPKNVLVLRARTDGLASELGVEPDALRERLASIDERLYEARSRRDQPGLDDKIIASWNGLMIEAFAHAAIALGETSYLDDAERAASWILDNMIDADGGLLRTARDGRAKTPAFLEDYAMLAGGLVATHRVNAATGRADLRYVTEARRLVEQAYERFADDSGALYDTRDARPDLIVRTSSSYDGAVPSGQSVMLHTLLELHDLTRDALYLDRAVALLGAMSASVRESPVATINTTRAVYRILRTSPEALDRLGERAEPEAPDPSADAVRVFARGERLTVPEAGAAEMAIRIEIGEGYHVNAPEPGVEGMVGLSAEVEGSESVRVTLEGPDGEPFEGGGLPEGEGPLLVYRGAVELTLRVERTGEAWAGRPIIVLTYQVCTDTACLAPRRVELDLALDP